MKKKFMELIDQGFINIYKLGMEIWWVKCVRGERNDEDKK